MIPAELIKNKFYKFYVSNEVLLGNAFALLLGDWITNILFMNRAGNVSESILVKVYYLDLSYGAACVVVMSTLILWYEQPVRKCLKALHCREEPDPILWEKARRRVLNAPYFVVVMDAVAWGIGSFLFWFIGSPAGISIGIGSGLITVTAAFFWVEHVSQPNIERGRQVL